MPKYLNVGDGLGNAILWVTGLDVLTGFNIGTIVNIESIAWKLGVAVFGVSVVIGRRVLQKYIDLNTPEKKE